MGQVFLAEDEHLNRKVALKVLAPQAMAQPDARHRFRREAHALSRLSHPDIATIYDFDSQEGIDFLVMEYVEGETLADRLKRSRMHEPELLELSTQICGTLVEAHSQGVLHRDLSPRNIMISKRGTVKVLDFGLAKLLDPEPTGEGVTDTVAVTRQVAGTVPYISPERLRREPADARADIYSLGAILYEMTTGHRIFEGVSQAELIAATLDREPRPIRELAQGISPDLERCILKALDKNPDLRYQTARELAVDIQRCRDSKVEPSPPPPIPPWVVGLLIAIVVGLTGVIITTLWSRNDPVEAVSMTALITGPELESASQISPNGRWISYQTSVGGDGQIWVQPISGGEPRPVVRIPGGLRGHCWSPDGEHLAYVRQGNNVVLLHATPAFGGPGQATVALPAELVLGAPVEWAGRFIYIDAPGSGLWMIDLESGESTLVLDIWGEEGRRFDFDVCPGAHRAAYTILEQDRYTLWAVDLPAGTPRRLTKHERSDIRPVWTGPRCRYVVHTSNRTGQSDLWRTNLNGRSARLTVSGDIEHAESGTHDGSLLSYREQIKRGDLWTLDSVQPIPTPRRLTADTLDDLWPSVARDANRVAFQRQLRVIEDFDPTSQSEILIADMTPRGLDALRSVAQRGGLARISADGKWLTYVTKPTADGARELRLLDLETRRTATLDRDVPLPAFGVAAFDPLWWDVHWSRATGELFYVVHGEGFQRIRRAVPGFEGEPETVVEWKDRGLRQPWATMDGKDLLYLLEWEERSAQAAQSPTRTRALRTELHRRSLVAGNDVVLFSEVHDPSELVVLLGAGADEEWLLLRNKPWDEAGPSADLLTVSKDGQTEIVMTFEGEIGSCALDSSTGQLYLTWISRGETAQNIYSMDVAQRSTRRLTANEQASTVFSRPEVFPGGRLLYTRHDSNSDIWLMRFER
jgi:serine/threonine protein kinase